MAKDLIHNAVNQALIHDGWIITHDPYLIRYAGEDLYADLAAERPFAAERPGEKIIVEVKSFLGYSVIQDFKEAIGQYQIYLDLLTETSPDYKLYLAVSDITYEYDFQREIVQFVLNKNRVPLLVVDVQTEEIVKWVR
jgi:hypothetical protein